LVRDDATWCRHMFWRRHAAGAAMAGRDTAGGAIVGGIVRYGYNNQLTGKLQRDKGQLSLN